MSQNKTAYLFQAVLVILVLVAGFLGVKLPNPPIPEPVPWEVDDGGCGPGEVCLESAVGQSIKFDRNIRAAQDVNIVGDLDVDSTLNVDSTMQVDGALTTDAALTAASAVIGGGYGDTGCTLSTAGVLQCNGAATLGSTLQVVDTVTLSGALGVGGATTISNADLTVSADSTGGDAGAINQLIGVPRIKLIGGGQGTNPASQTISLFDDTPDGEWAPVDADVVETADTTHYKYGSKSYKAAFAATAAAGDGIIDAALGASAAWDDMESAGLLVYSSVTLAAGDLTLVLTDDGGARTFNIPAITTANKWTWVEVDISTGDLSAVSDVAIKLSTAGATATGVFDFYVDIAYVWDSADEEALGVAIQQDGILGVIDTESGAQLVELTDYIVHYESGNDFIVYISDQSAADIAVLAAY
jgi:hypothetical protein